MKNRYLFRGKVFCSKEWIYGFLTNDSFINNILVIEETVSQFTGLTDKNEVKIFENDKLTDGVIIYVVEYNTQNTSFCIKPIERVKGDLTIVDSIDYQKLGNGYYSRKDLEIIGSIHK